MKMNVLKSASDSKSMDVVLPSISPSNRLMTTMATTFEDKEIKKKLNHIAGTSPKSLESLSLPILPRTISKSSLSPSQARSTSPSQVQSSSSPSSYQTNIIFQTIENLPPEQQISLLEALQKENLSSSFLRPNLPSMESPERESLALNPLNDLNSPFKGIIDMETSSQAPSIGQKSIMTYISSTGSKTVEKLKMSHIMKLIAIGMQKNPLSLLQYDLTGRGYQDLVGPTMLRERLLTDFKVQLHTSDIELLMKKFDADRAGVIPYVSVLGCAKNSYVKSKVISRKKKDISLNKPKLKLGNNPNSLAKDSPTSSLARGLSYHDGDEPSSNEIKPHQLIMMKLGLAAAHAIKSKKIKFLRLCGSRRLFPREFRKLLIDMDVTSLSNREYKFLEKLYHQHEDGTVDVVAFRNDFTVFGRETLQNIRDTEALRSYAKAMKRSENETLDDLSFATDVSLEEKNSNRRKQMISSGMTIGAGSYLIPFKEEMSEIEMKEELPHEDSLRRDFDGFTLEGYEEWLRMTPHEAAFRR